MSTRILEEAAHLFYHQGYGSSSIRDLAAAVGISSSTLYHHYPNKEAILSAVLERFMRDFNAALVPILRDASQPPSERLRATVLEHIVFSQRRRSELLVGQPFRHVLDRRTLARIVRLQRAYRDAVIELITEGVREGVFDVADPKATTMVLLDALNGLREWYRAEGERTIDELAETYAELALRMCGASSARLEGGEPTTPRRAAGRRQQPPRKSRRA